jgi:hypothetical protein
MNQLTLNDNPIVCWGDTHGKWLNFIHLLEDGLFENTNFIQVGDFGVGFFSWESENFLLTEMAKELQKNNCTLYVIRGNHDNPTWFKGKHAHWQPQIYFLEDYTVLSQGMKNILCVGGAISIDREHLKINDRKRMFEENFNPSWFKKEGFVFDKVALTEIVNILPTIDVVVTHTKPSIFPPFVLSHRVHNYAKTDSKLLIDLAAETVLVQKVYDFLVDNGKRPSKWFYGHFHYSEVYDFEGCIGNILGVDELKELIL